MQILRRFFMLFTAMWLSCSLLLLSGCEQREQADQAPVSSSGQTINIGLIPEENIFAQKKRYEPLARYLSEKCGINIELKILSRYGNIIDNFKSEELDGAFFGSFTGAMACRKLNVVPLARPEYVNANSTYYGLIFTRKDSGIQTAADMKNRRFAFVDKATTAGWLLPLYYFKEQGIADYENWFSETYFTGTHEDAILDVLNKKADIGAAKNTVFERMSKKYPRVSDELTVLAMSPKVPANSLLVRKDLDQNLINKLRKNLLAMDLDPTGQHVLKNFGSARFIETKEYDYDPVFEYAEEIGLDLTNYDYTNN